MLKMFAKYAVIHLYIHCATPTLADV